MRPLFWPLVVAALLGTSAHTQPRAALVEIESPRYWVAFSADAEVINRERGLHLTGKFFRDENGSTRWEQHTPGPTVVTIMNRLTGTLYRGHLQPSGRTRWTAQPMELAPEDAGPPRWHRGMAGLKDRTVRMEGFEALEQVQEDGVVRLLVPALNFFSVQTLANPVTGTLERYSSIAVVASHPALLFEPGVDASIEFIATPGGITRGRTNPD